MTIQRSSMIFGLFIFASGTVFGESVIIESRPCGMNHDHYSEPVGKWLDSNNPANTAKSSAPGLSPQGSCGSRKATLPTVPPSDPKAIIASARFNPKLSAAGRYFVYVTFSRAGNATPVTYVIKHAKGEDKREIAQDGWGGTGSPNGNIWIGLGEYEFGTDPDQGVEMQLTGETGLADPRSGGQAFADAVQFSTDPVSVAVAAKPAAAPKAPLPSALGAGSGAGSTPAATTTAKAPAKVDDGAPLDWKEDIRKAQGLASASGKNILVFFFSPESERTINYDTKVFKDPRVSALLKSKFVLVRINMEENKDLARNLQVFRAGTINIYDSQGNGLNQYTETMTAEDMIQNLKEY